MGLDGLLEFFCNLTVFLLEYCSIDKNKLTILLLARFIEKKNKRALDVLAVDIRKNASLMIQSAPFLQPCFIAHTSLTATISPFMALNLQ